MRVIAQEEKFIGLSKTEKYGFILLENEPIHRTISFYKSANFLVDKGRFPFPYVQYLVCYTVENGEYHFHGFREGGLRVYFSKSPFENFNQKVSCSWVEGYYLNSLRHGLICTTHQFDPYISNSGKTMYKKSADNIFDIVDFQISTFWGMVHNFSFFDKYFNDELMSSSLEEICKEKFDYFSEKFNVDKKGFLKPISNLIQNSKRATGTVTNRDRLYPSLDTKIIDKEFHKNWKLEEPNSVKESLEFFQKEFLKRNK